MPYDALLMFSRGQAITTTAVSQDVLDLGSPSLNPRTGTAFPVNAGGGDGGPAIVVKVTTTFAGLTSLTATLQGSTDGTTFVDIGSTGAVPVAQLRAGYEFGFRASPIRQPYRYLRLNYTVAGTGTAGVVTAGMNDGFNSVGMV